MDPEEILRLLSKVGIVSRDVTRAQPQPSNDTGFVGDPGVSGDLGTDLLRQASSFVIGLLETPGVGSVLDAGTGVTPAFRALSATKQTLLNKPLRAFNRLFSSTDPQPAQLERMQELSSELASRNRTISVLTEKTHKAAGELQELGSRLSEREEAIKRLRGMLGLDDEIPEGMARRPVRPFFSRAQAIIPEESVPIVDRMVEAMEGGFSASARRAAEKNPNLLLGLGPVEGRPGVFTTLLPTIDDAGTIADRVTDLSNPEQLLRELTSGGENIFKGTGLTNRDREILIRRFFSSVYRP